MISSHRAAAVAGQFYPGEESACRRQLAQLMGEAGQSELPGLRGLVLPHAGYIYSGRVAATGVSAMPGDELAGRTIAVIGPNHRVPLRGMALDNHSHFTTPLGAVPVHRGLVDELATLAGVEVNNAAHEGEHCIEVQLPFLQYRLGDFTLLPVLVGQSPAGEVSALIDRLVESGAFILVSSDLSHFLAYSEARQLDAETSAAITGLATDIQPRQACGSGAINGLNAYARRHDWQARCLALENSGDSAGDKDRVVGYGAYAYA